MNNASQGWLHKLVGVQPALYWPWRHSLRLTLITTLPLLVGSYYDNLGAALLVCLGGLLSSISVQTDPYRDRLYRIVTAIPFGMSGYLIGSAIAGNSFVTTIGVVLVASMAAWISFAGKAFSAGALQMLSMTVIAAHAPQTGWSLLTMPLFFGLGALYAAFLLTIEALILPKKPQLKLSSLVFTELAGLGRVAAEKGISDSKISDALKKVKIAQANAYQVLKHASSTQTGVNQLAGVRILALVDRLSVVFAMNELKSSDLRFADSFLTEIADSIEQQRSMERPDKDTCENGELAGLLQQLANLFSKPLIFKNDALQNPYKQIKSSLTGSYKTGLVKTARQQRHNFIDIVSLALCMLVAMLAEFNLPGSRSYWIPLSVAVILKPDFGSVFARAIQRSAGTLVGVLIAALAFYFIPKGLGLVIVIGVLSALLPWSSLKNYAWQCAFLTPLILILIDLIIAGPNINYGSQRLLDTLLGAAIVLIFGYLIWPKPARETYLERFSHVLLDMGKYLKTVEQVNTNSDIFDLTLADRHKAYSQLFAMRKWVQGFLADPPSVSREAKIWLPLLDEAEDLIDQISVYAERLAHSTQVPKFSKFETLQKNIEELDTRAHSLK